MMLPRTCSAALLMAILWSAPAAAQQPAPPADKEPAAAGDEAAKGEGPTEETAAGDEAAADAADGDAAATPASEGKEPEAAAGEVEPKPQGEDAAAKPAAKRPEPPPAPPPHLRNARSLPPLGGQAAADVVERPDPEFVHHMFTAGFGVRNMFIANRGYDPYSEDNLLAAASMSFNVAPVYFGPLGLAATAEYDIGASSATARGEPSALTMHRLALGVEAHYELWRLQLFARVIPAALYARATIDDSALGRSLVGDKWTWSVDATGGFRFRLGSAGGDEIPAVRFWLSAELGYSFAGEMEMLFSPEQDEDDPRQFGSVALPALRPEGVVNRLAFNVSF